MEKVRWWMVSAAVIGVLMMMFGVGNLLDPDDGPLYGRLILLAVMTIGAALIVTGLTRLRRGDVTGGRLVAVGVLPGAIGVMFFWFPPALIAGVLAIVTAPAAAGFRTRESQKAHV
jgi:hypothetical protein